MYSIQHYVIKFVSDLWLVWFSPGTPVSSNNKTDRHDITEILLEVALNTITLTPLCQSRVIVGNPQLITFRLLSNSSWLRFDYSPLIMKGE